MPVARCVWKRDGGKAAGSGKVSGTRLVAPSYPPPAVTFGRPLLSISDSFVPLLVYHLKRLGAGTHPSHAKDAALPIRPTPTTATLTPCAMPWLVVVASAVWTA